MRGREEVEVQEERRSPFSHSKLRADNVRQEKRRRG